MTELIKLLTEKEFHYHRISSLIFILLIIFSLIPTLLLPQIHEFKKDLLIDLSITITILFAISLHWRWYRENYPKSKGSKPYIVLAIETENLIQKTRIQKDLKNQIDKRLEEYLLRGTIQTKTLHNHLAENINLLVKEARDFGILSSRNLKWVKIQKILDKMNCPVLIYGSLKLRDSPDSAYYLSIDVMISHNPIKLPVSNVLAKSMQEVWKNEIKVLINDEYQGFKATGDHMSVSAAFMTALAAFANMQFDKSISILESLNIVNVNPDFTSYVEPVKRLKATCYQLGAGLAHHQGDHEKSREYYKKSDKLIPNFYNKCLSEAAFHEKKGNTELAMSLIDKSITFSNGDGTWRYSKLYLNIRLKRFDEAIRVLKVIESSTFLGENAAIQSVLSYINNTVEEDEAFIQSHFILGFIFYKKKANYPISYEEFGKFVEKTKDSTEWSILRDKAEEYIVELNKLMSIKD